MKLTILLLAIFVAGFFWLRQPPFDWRLARENRPWNCTSLPPVTDSHPHAAVERQICFQLDRTLDLPITR